MKPLDQVWSIAQSVELACVLEAAAPKLGNVHPGARFVDMHFGHFVASAAAVSPLFASAGDSSVGQLVLSAASATRQHVGCNTNLGTLLLLAPLAVSVAKTKAAGHALTPQRLAESTGLVLQSLDHGDCRDVYAAIRVAAPGGLGKRNQDDVHESAPENLIEAMRQVALVDAVARQYVTGFEDVLQRLWPWLMEELEKSDDPLNAIVRLQLRWLACEPDGLILRKLGRQEAERIQQRAAEIQDLWLAGSKRYQTEYRRLDDYLRESGHGRNPGTTADLIAATLFCQLVADKKLV